MFLHSLLSTYKQYKCTLRYFWCQWAERMGPIWVYKLQWTMLLTLPLNKWVYCNTLSKTIQYLFVIYPQRQMVIQFDTCHSFVMMTLRKISTANTTRMTSSHWNLKKHSSCGLPVGSPGGWGCTKHHVQTSWAPALQSSPLQGCLGPTAPWSPAHTANHTDQQVKVDNIEEQLRKTPHLPPERVKFQIYFTLWQTKLNPKFNFDS